jgi:SAM-dependent methyltransferase
VKKMPEIPLMGRTKMAFNWLPNVDRVIDVGCAWGYLSAHLSQKARDVFGIDFNRDAISRAKIIYPNGNFQVASVEDLPFMQNTFDAVVMLDVLEHVQNDTRAIDEVYRILKDDGTLILSVPNDSPVKFLDPKLFWGHRHYSLQKVIKLFADRFEVVRVHRGGFIVYPLVSTAQLILRKITNKLSKSLSVIAEVDYLRDFGRLGYNMMILARKRK